MPAARTSSQILRDMAAELDACAIAAEERAKMQDRLAEAKSHQAKRDEHVVAAGRSRDAAAFNRRRQQALLDGARLLEAAERSAA